jgi:hypothetical protein
MQSAPWLQMGPRSRTPTFFGRSESARTPPQKQTGGGCEEEEKDQLPQIHEVASMG